MHLMHMLERWAAPNAPVDLNRRQNTRTPALTLPLTSDIATLISSAQTTAKADPTTTPQNTPTPSPTPDQTTQQTQQTTAKPSTTVQSSSQPSTTNKPATTNAPASSNTSKGTQITITSNAPASQGTDVPTGVTDSAPTFAATTSAAAKSTSSGDSGFGNNGKAVATGVGVVAGVVGGLALIMGVIYMWRRHQRRKQMERIGSMEELPRPPSPGPLSRSFTRGHGPRQPIDDDDDDFLTPMDTLPNTHRMDDWDSTKSSPQHSETAMYDDKSVYAESVYHEDHGDLGYSDQAMAGGDYVTPPPPAVTAANGRFYSGDFTNLQSSGAPVGSTFGEASSPSAASSGGAIPIYSAMNKYAAYTAAGAGTAITSPSATSPVYGAAPNQAPMNNQRPGGGYRAHDSYDAGGYV